MVEISSTNSLPYAERWRSSQPCRSSSEAVPIECMTFLSKPTYIQKYESNTVYVIYSWEEIAETWIGLWAPQYFDEFFAVLGVVKVWTYVFAVKFPQKICLVSGFLIPCCLFYLSGALQIVLRDKWRIWIRYCDKYTRAWRDAKVPRCCHQWLVMFQSLLLYTAPMYTLSLTLLAFILFRSLLRLQVVIMWLDLDT